MGVNRQSYLGSEHVEYNASLAGESFSPVPKETRVIIGSNARCEPVDRDKPFSILSNGEFVNVSREELRGATPTRLNTLSANGGVATIIKQINSVKKCLVAPDSAPSDPIRTKHCTREELESLKKQFPGLFEETDLVLYPISDRDRRGHYIDVSNGHFWPAFHNLLKNLPDNYPTLDAYEIYHQVNRRMADYLIKEATAENAEKYNNIIWVQDYQLCEVPAMVREALPDAKVGSFIHIPFTRAEDFIASMGEGHARDMIHGLLGSDIIGFQVKEYADNFWECCGKLGYQVENAGLGKYVLVPEEDREGHLAYRRVRIFDAPITVEAERIRKVIQYNPEIDRRNEDVENAIAEAIRWRKSNLDKKLLFGAERLDYSKGIEERLEAIRFILKNPKLFPGAAGHFVLRQEAEKSRQEVPKYKLLADKVAFLVKDVNDYAEAEYGKQFPGWKPVEYGVGVKQVTLYALSSVADATIVNPAADGLNLVIKETILAKYFALQGAKMKETFDDKTKEFLSLASTAGTSFILGQGAGAAMELRHAGMDERLCIVDGTNIKEIAKAIYAALGLGEQTQESQKVQVENVEALGDYYIKHPPEEWVDRNIDLIEKAANERWNQVGVHQISSGTIQANTEYGHTLAQGLSPSRFSSVVNESVNMRQELEEDRLIRALKPSRGNITWITTIEGQQALSSPLYVQQLAELLNRVPGDRLHLIVGSGINTREVEQILGGSAVIHSSEDIKKDPYIISGFERLRRVLTDSDFFQDYNFMDWTTEGSPSEIIVRLDKFGSFYRKFERDTKIQEAVDGIIKIACEEAGFGEGDLSVTRKDDRLFFTANIFTPGYIVAQVKGEEPCTTVFISDKADDVSAFRMADLGIFIGRSDENPRSAYGLDNVFGLLSYGDMGPVLRRYARK